MATDAKTAASSGKGVAALSPEKGLTQLLNLSYQQLAAHYAVFITQGGEQALHDLRVSTRKLRSLLRNYRNFIETDKVLSQQLRAIQRHTNQARDLEVFIEQLRAYSTAPNHLAGELDSQLQHAYQQLRRELPKVWGHIPPDSFTSLKLKHLDTFSSLGALSTTTARQPFKRLKKGLRSLRHKWDEEQLHQLRIHAKQLRYLLEPFIETDKVDKAIGTLKGFQDELGEYRDLQLLIEHLKTEQSVPTPLTGLLQQQRQQRKKELKRYIKPNVQRKFLKPLRRAIRELNSHL